MKRIRSVLRLGPAYTYSWQNGVARHWPGVILSYAVLLIIPVALLVVFNNLQVKNSSQSPQKNLSASAVFDRPAIQQQLLPSGIVTVSPKNDELDSVINDFISDNPGFKWSVSVVALNGYSSSGSANSSAKYDGASLYKLLLMYPLAQKLPFSQWDSKELVINGHNISLGDCAAAMLKFSDNDCGDAIGNYVGWPYADSQLHAIGLINTRLNNASGPITTASDISFYLQGLYNGKWFDGPTRNFIVNTLQTQIYRSGIPAGCGLNCVVADKIGDLGFVRHDAGIVQYPGGAYVLVVMTNGASYTDIAQLAGQIQSYMSDQ